MAAPVSFGSASRGRKRCRSPEEQRIEAEWTAHLGKRRMAQLREALTMLREITDPYAP